MRILTSIIICGMIPIMTMAAEKDYTLTELINVTGFIAECPLTGTETEIASSCSTWCKNRYGNTINGALVTSDRCSHYNVPTNFTDYKYCCVNNISLQIRSKCKCNDDNQITTTATQDKQQGHLSQDAIEISLDGTVKCINRYCFCDTGYYGARQLLTQSKTGTCTRCPEWTGVTVSGQKVYGTVANNYLYITNANAPSTTITDCKFEYISDIPEQYRKNYTDKTGSFKLTAECPYKN